MARPKSNPTPDPQQGSEGNNEQVQQPGAENPNPDNNPTPDPYALAVQLVHNAKEGLDKLAAYRIAEGMAATRIRKMSDELHNILKVLRQYA